MKTYNPQVHDGRDGLEPILGRIRFYFDDREVSYIDVTNGPNGGVLLRFADIGGFHRMAVLSNCSNEIEIVAVPTNEDGTVVVEATRP